MTKETALELQKEKKEETLKANSNGMIFEAPSKRPFEGYTYLKKVWIDRQDDIESVSFNHINGHLKQPAKWTHMQTNVMMPEWGNMPLKRTWVVRLPTHFENQEKYLFHYFFQVTYQDGREEISDTFTELIVPRQIEYIDHSGSYTHIRLHWSLNGWLYPQNTELEIEGVKWGSDYSVSQSEYRFNDRLYEQGRARLVAQIPAPHVYKTMIWGPKGAEVHYCFNLISSDKEGNLSHTWDNNQGKDFKLIL